MFSSVIKCVEEGISTAEAGQNLSHGAAVAGRVVAMKIIRNNEIMARAAAKEMRILRMLCRPEHPRSGGSSRSQKGEGGRAITAPMAEDDEDPEERARRERENHHVVRLLTVDPAAGPDASAATHPPEFRSHCVLMFEFLPYNLREVLSKFGKHVGISLTAVRSYARQLLCALGHLERHRVVHGTCCHHLCCFKLCLHVSCFVQIWLLSVRATSF